MKRTELRRKTELKRGGSLKRTGFKNRGKPIKRRNKSKKAKPAVVRQYMDENQTDELDGIDLGDDWKAFESRHPITTMDTHHVMFGNRKRIDVPENLIAIPRNKHDYFHKYKHRGQVICMLAKLQRPSADKTKLRAEWEAIIGTDLLEWLESIKCKVDAKRQADVDTILRMFQ